MEMLHFLFFFLSIFFSFMCMRFLECTPGGTSSWGSSIGLEFLHERCSQESLVKLTIGDFARVHQLYITIHVTTEKKEKRKKRGDDKNKL